MMFPAQKALVLIVTAVSVDGIKHSGGQSLWARVGDGVFRVPLGSSIGEYYYAYCSRGALTEELRSRRVAGQGRLHVFHLPGGPDAALGAGVAESLPRAGTRRAAISSLMQLKHGQVLNATFPPYELSPAYKHPLNAEGVSLEERKAGLITPEGVMLYLELITEEPTRSYTNPEESRKEVEMIKSRFESFGYKACSQTFDYFQGEQTNVIAVIPGSDPNGGSVTIGAHYDSRPFQGKAPGAIDNGSGSAALLAIADALQKDFRPVKTVYFVAFAAEEPGLVGSNAFAEALVNQALPEGCQHSGGRHADHKAIVMDEIAWRSPKVEAPTVNLEAYDWASDVLQHLGQASGALNGRGLLLEHSSDPFGSDHMSFLDRRLQAALTIQADDGAYPDYHRPTDSIGNADKVLLARISKMNLGALMRLSGVQGMMA